MIRFYTYIIAGLLAFSPAYSTEFAGITRLVFTDQHLISTPWSGRFRALNDDLYNVDEFYANQRPAFNARARFTLYESRNRARHWRVSLPVHIDNGYASALYTTSRYVGLGLRYTHLSRGGLRFEFDASDALQYGGVVRERPCYDAFRRAFHCGTGLAWGDMVDTVQGAQGSTEIRCAYYARVLSPMMGMRLLLLGMVLHLCAGCALAVLPDGQFSDFDAPNFDLRAPPQPLWSSQRAPSGTATQSQGGDYTQGTPSNHANAITAYRNFYMREFQFTLSVAELVNFRDVAPDQFTATRNQQTLIAMRDTNAEQAWLQGWTGRGVGLGYLDDFTTKDIFPFRPYASGVDISASHGDLVRLVGVQVAPEATNIAQQITFGCDVTGAQQDTEIRNALRNFQTHGHHIVNMSFATSRYNGQSCNPGGTPFLHSRTDWDRWTANAANDPVTRAIALTSIAQSYSARMLFVYAAGNDGANCPHNIAGCTLSASAIMKLRNDGNSTAGNRVIFVGALAHGSDTLADYSQKAGDMQNDYLVAHAAVINENEYRGTSFAAPRVAGAAALVRHKFPNLDGAQLKQVILQTADDLGDPGPDAVYGYGKLNVLNALSPIGRVVAQ